MKQSFTVEIDTPDHLVEMYGCPNCNDVKWALEEEIRRVFYRKFSDEFMVNVIYNPLETNELQGLPKAEDFSPPIEETYRENMQVLGLNT